MDEQHALEERLRELRNEISVSRVRKDARDDAAAYLVGLLSRPGGITHPTALVLGANIIASLATGKMAILRRLYHK